MRSGDERTGKMGQKKKSDQRKLKRVGCLRRLMIQCMCFGLLIMICLNMFGLHNAKIAKESEVVAGANGVSGIDFQHGKTLRDVEKKRITKAPSSFRLQLQAEEKSLAAIVPALERTALLIICHEREEAVRRCLKKVVQYHPCDDSMVVVSQDRSDRSEKKIAAVVDEYLLKLKQKCKNTVETRRIVHRAQTLDGSGYHKLARHFKFALSSVFSFPNVQRCIILEEDLIIAPDFFHYFNGLAPILDTDQTLFAVSAWNDNGQKSRGIDPERILRSDFFPGLGWMLTRRIWLDELRDKWPAAYWDDWLREPEQRKGRHVLRPELCRTFHTLAAGTGTSRGQYANFLTTIHLYIGPPIDFAASPQINALALQEYDSQLLHRLRSTTLLDSARDPRLQTKTRIDTDTKSPPSSATAFRIQYNSVRDNGPHSFPALARTLGIMDNEKAGIPRTAYRGVIEFFHNGHYLYLTPPLDQVEARLFRLDGT